ncbi:hypothetical protein [Rhizobium sp. B21/90]|uniref:hypothetical protein n=1 Tax=Rhizobium sp. B21/90 TaxID=2819993 RepID=UPI001C5AB75F|nr:hypothetical protein [Rhizobium sp. B21/90]QYA03895.1 hypothetical protein J5278_24255 [Rhizobium sp. B21/90]
MNRDPAIPTKLPDLSVEMRKFLAGVRDDEIPNLRIVVELREDEIKRFVFLTTQFTIEDLQTMSDSLENLRTIKRFGKFGAWFAGFVAAGAAAAAIVKGWLWTGGPK